jgi:hypothetical protein
VAGWSSGGTSVASPIIASTYALGGNLSGYPAQLRLVTPRTSEDVTTGGNGTYCNNNCVVALRGLWVTDPRHTETVSSPSFLKVQLQPGTDGVCLQSDKNGRPDDKCGRCYHVDRRMRVNPNRRACFATVFPAGRWKSLPAVLVEVGLRIFEDPNTPVQREAPWDQTAFCSNRSIGSPGQTVSAARRHDPEPRLSPAAWPSTFIAVS